MSLALLYVWVQHAHAITQIVRHINLAYETLIQNNFFKSFQYTQLMCKGWKVLLLNKIIFSCWKIQATKVMHKVVLKTKLRHTKIAAEHETETTFIFFIHLFFCTPHVAHFDQRLHIHWTDGVRLSGRKNAGSGK